MTFEMWAKGINLRQYIPAFVMIMCACGFAEEGFKVQRLECMCVMMKPCSFNPLWVLCLNLRKGVKQQHQLNNGVPSLQDKGPKSTKKEGLLDEGC